MRQRSHFFSFYSTLLKNHFLDFCRKYSPVQTVRHLCCTCLGQLDLYRQTKLQAVHAIVFMLQDRCETTDCHKTKLWSLGQRRGGWWNNIIKGLKFDKSSPFPCCIPSTRVHFFCSKFDKDIQCNQKTSLQQRMWTNGERQGNKSVSEFHIAILFPVSSYSLPDLWSQFSDCSRLPSRNTKHENNASMCFLKLEMTFLYLWWWVESSDSS